jgi:hypothetical protein
MGCCGKKPKFVRKRPVKGRIVKSLKGMPKSHCPECSSPLNILMRSQTAVKALVCPSKACGYVRWL